MRSGTACATRRRSPTHPVPTIAAMARSSARHRCRDCDTTSARAGWGRCPGCGEWNTLFEEVPRRPPVPQRPSSIPAPCRWRSERSTPPRPPPSRPVSTSSTGCSQEVSCPVSVTLLGGEPGIGKSTLVLQMLAARATASDRGAPDLGGGVRPPGPIASGAAGPGPHGSYGPRHDRPRDRLQRWWTSSPTWSWSIRSRRSPTTWRHRASDTLPASRTAASPGSASVRSS